MQNPCKWLYSRVSGDMFFNAQPETNQDTDSSSNHSGNRIDRTVFIFNCQGTVIQIMTGELQHEFGNEIQFFRLFLLRTSGI